MKRLRRKLTYANVISTCCLFLLLGGGTAFAASQLGKESIGTKELKKEAVTPAKLSKASKRVLVGPAGPIGSQGPVGKEGAAGKEGPPGKEGPQGPGAVTIEDIATSTIEPVTTLDGVEILDYCNGTSIEIELDANASTNTLAAFGTYTSNTTVNPEHVEGFSGLSFFGANAVDTALVVRNTAVSMAFDRFDLHIQSNGCKFTGMVTPSTVG
jgi:hypothetical protein